MTKKKTSSKKTTAKNKKIKAEEFWKAMRFKEEALVGDKLRTLLHADVIEPIIEKCRFQLRKDYWHSVFSGHSFHIDKDLSPGLFKMCQEVLDTLQFTEPVNFFITNDPQVNAAAFMKGEGDNSHVVVINSGLVESFGEKELKFVIGHEIGHLIYKTAEIRRLIHYLFEEERFIPISIQNLISLWEKFAEISADRMGFIASPCIESCITNFFKLSSGISLEKVNLNAKAFMHKMDEMLEQARRGEFQILFHSSHPSNPVRVKAIQLFSESKVYTQYASSGKVVKNDKELSKEMQGLLDLMELFPTNQRDYYRSMVVAAGGILLAGLDDKISMEENDEIVEYLAKFTARPKVFLENIQKQVRSKKGLKEILIGAIFCLLEADPEERYSIFYYLCRIVIADHALNHKEINFLMDIAVEHLGMHEIEANRLFLENLRHSGFAPRF
ncbi:M48 family metallopeptidase [Candidatus Uabimicrobium amorphum]|uniref:Zn-dependent protease n=1 Tax=Uabimicrobium amorphum TaxID=2596890 RepID=A0A5S9IK34_UABAM|nr:M48 family metallopeptidase [Candidatus Uabimicrobium amorphum]BBM82045.1 Zn-dependent protease [Candidatus Uabimicrobium amorphum]